MITVSIQSGASLEAVAGQLEGIGGNGKFNPPLAHAIGTALLDIAASKNEKVTDDDEDDSDIDALDAVLPPIARPETRRPVGAVCPECNNISVVLEEGCKKCVNCGWSAC